MTDRPLSHIRVLDFGQYLAGPLVGMMLADLGAEVIRIDPPGGPRLKEPATGMLSRGKAAHTLDLKREAGRAEALELARRSDVVIENFRPGVMDRLGVGPEAMCAANAGLVYLSMPGFASSDAALAGLPAWEAVIAACTGQFTDMGLNRVLMGINPSFTPLAMASAYGAAFGAMAVLFALHARERNGGDRIEVPLASALLEGLAYNCQLIENYPERYKSPRERELDRRRAAGLANNLRYAEVSELLDPLYRTYRCADGRMFYLLACSVRRHPRRVLEVLGLESLLAELPDFDCYRDSAEWPDSWTLRNYPVGDRDRPRIAAALKEVFRTRPAQEWEDLFGAAGAPGVAHRHTREWLADPHAHASGLILEVDDPRYGPMRQMGNLAWLADDPGALTKTAGPGAEAAVNVAALDERAASGAGSGAGSGWLDGLRILDLTNVIAGPTIGSTVARFGAEVTSVQPVEPSVDPWNAVVFGVHAHRGKRSALLNLSSGPGREALRRLVAMADVITINAPDPQCKRLGLDPAELAVTHPETILVQLDAFGGPRRGPMSDYLGYDDLAQALTGVMTRFGGGMETPEEHAHFGTIDVLCGYCACVALGGALVRKGRTGKGGTARASLAASGSMIQAQFMYDYAGRAPFDEPAGREVLGWGANYRCYRAADDWFFLAAPTHSAEALARAAGFDAPPAAEAQEVWFAARFARRPVAYWRQRLNRGSAAVVRLASLQETREQARQVESEGAVDLDRATFRVIRHDRHPMGRWCDLVAPNAVRSQTGRITVPGPMPPYGAHTREILAEAGFSTDAIGEMIRDGAAALSWSEKYLPE